MKETLDRLVVGVAAASAAFFLSSCSSGQGGKVDASARADAAFCVVAGKSYAVGETFGADCNTCSCEANLQVSCTTMVCVTDAAAGPPGQDASPIDGPGISVADAPSQDQKTAADLAPADVPAADGGASDAPDDAARADAPFAADSAPGDGRPVVEVASTPGCTLPTTLTFGHDGGNVLFQYANQLATSGIVIVSRVPVRGYRDGGVLSCAWALPACGTPGAVTLATIAADLADADVQAGFAADATPLYGIDERPSDGSIFSITRADGHTILVGVPCSWRPSDPCLAIPAGVQRLADDLASLSSAALADPACQGLSVY